MELRTKVSVEAHVPGRVSCEAQAQPRIRVIARSRAQKDGDLHPLCDQGQRDTPSMVPEQKNARHSNEREEETEGGEKCSELAMRLHQKRVGHGCSPGRACNLNPRDHLT